MGEGDSGKKGLANGRQGPGVDSGKPTSLSQAQRKLAGGEGEL